MGVSRVVDMCLLVAVQASRWTHGWKWGPLGRAGEREGIRPLDRVVGAGRGRLGTEAGSWLVA